MGLIMAFYLGLYGILSGLTKSTDHPRDPGTAAIIINVLGSNIPNIAIVSQTANAPQAPALLNRLRPLHEVERGR